MSWGAGQRDLLAIYLEQRDALSRFFRARLGNQADIDDLLQELYLKLQSSPDEEIREPKAYLYRLASNLMMDRWRSVMRASVRDGAWAALHQAEVDDAPSAEAVVAARQGLSAVTTELKRLPEATQTVFRLHKFEGLSYAEVALRLNVSRSTVEKRMMQALRALAERRMR